MKEIEKEAYKRIPFEILKYVDDFCEKNQIRYSLAYGTLLGAIRHKGFIPWDDDIDIIMPRKDYERFKKLYHSERYPFSDMMVNPKHPTGMGKIYDTNTIFFYRKKIKRSYGLFVDVFVVDKFPADESERVLWLKQIRELININNTKNTGFFDLIKVDPNKKNLIKKLMTKMRPCSINSLHRQIFSLSQKYDAADTGLVGITMSVDNPWDTYPDNTFEEFIKVDFEGHQFSAIKNYDLWLKTCYGNYMQLPPVEKQTGKHDIIAYYK